MAREQTADTPRTFGEAEAGTPEAQHGTGIGTTGAAPQVATGVMTFDPYTGTWSAADDATAARHERAVSRSAAE